jgi:hypothetical protein
MFHVEKNWYLRRERRTKAASVKEPIGNRVPEKRKNLILRAGAG